MPSLNNLFLSYQKDGFIVLAVSTDDSEKPVQSFIRKKAIAFPVLIDKDQEVYFDKYGVIGLPTSFLIDRDGLVREKFLGDRPWDAPEMKEKIEKLLSKKTGRRGNEDLAIKLSLLPVQPPTLRADYYLHRNS